MCIGVDFCPGCPHMGAKPPQSPFYSSNAFFGLQKRCLNHKTTGDASRRIEYQNICTESWTRLNSMTNDFPTVFSFECLLLKIWRLRFIFMLTYIVDIPLMYLCSCRCLPTLFKLATSSSNQCLQFAHYHCNWPDCQKVEVSWHKRVFTL